jgi:tetratricopeptide (TPR) repeat protein
MTRTLAAVTLTAIAIAPSARAQEAASPPKAMPTVLVLPAEGKGRALGDVGDAVQLRLVGTLRAAGGTNLVHPKMYLRVMERYDQRLANVEDDKRIQALGEIVGADVVVSSVVESEGDETVVELMAVPIRYEGLGGDVTKGRASGKTLIDALNAMPGPLLTLLKGTGRVPELKTPSAGAIGPDTASQEALLEYAACSVSLMAQPLGLRNPIVVDQAVLKQSEELCLGALRHGDNFADPHAELALIAALRGDREKAEAELKKARQSETFNSSYHLAKFWVLSRYYDVELALQTLREAIRVHPGFMLGRGYLGEALLALGRAEDSEKAFRDYLAAAPRQSWVMGQIGYALAKQRKYDEAVEWTEKGLRTRPGDAELLLQLASRFIDTGRHAEAVTLLKRVVSEGGARGEIHLRLGYAYLKLGKYNEAERQIRTAILKAEGSAEWRTRGRARYNLAQLWLASGSPDNAMRQLRMAVREGFRDRPALEAPSMAQLRDHPGYAELLATDPRKGIAPQYVSPLGQTSETGELVPNSGKAGKKADPSVLDRF